MVENLEDSTKTVKPKPEFLTIFFERFLSLCLGFAVFWLSPWGSRLSTTVLHGNHEAQYNITSDFVNSTLTPRSPNAPHRKTRGPQHGRLRGFPDPREKPRSLNRFKSKKRLCAQIDQNWLETTIQAHFSRSVWKGLEI